MPEAKDFRTIRVQASLFTPHLQFRASKLFAHLLTQYGEHFDGEPTAIPMTEDIPQDIPRLVLTSADKRLRLQAAAVRLDMIREEDGITNEGMAEFLNWTTTVGLDYVKVTGATVGRVACIAGRVVLDAQPGKTLAEHFCQDRWLQGPLNRPDNFEIHAHKRFRPKHLFEINSWFRCKSGVLERAGKGAAAVIILEQDFNSLSEQMDAREISEDEIRRFFEVSPAELQEVVNLYFPNKD